MVEIAHTILVYLEERGAIIKVFYYTYQFHLNEDKVKEDRGIFV